METVDQEQKLRTWIEKKRTLVDLEKIPGDASTRRYYRVRLKDSSLILMQMESFSELGTQVPFIQVQSHLATAGVDVPAIVDIQPSEGWILLEDLGDVTLLRRLQEVVTPEVERHLYQRVLDSLVHLQVFASPAKKPAKIDGYQMRFDFEKLMWEVRFTIEHFYEGYLKRSLPDSDRKTLEEGFGLICRALDAEPTVFTHRDFHSRNIMSVQKGEMERFVMIDFQDARLGPAQYDLASLLKDSYYQLEEAQIEKLLDYYVARWEGVSGKKLDSQHFRRIFDWMAVQRNFKAIGSFASFYNKRGNPSYLKFIGNTFENIRRTLLKYPEFSDLRETLFHYYYF